MSDFSKSIATSTTFVKKAVTRTESKLDKKPGLKFKYSLYSALAFFLLASPQVFSFVNSLIGSFVKVSDPNGCPTAFGLILHTIIFLGLLYLMMSLPRDED
jgi:hypothetical protein